MDDRHAPFNEGQIPLSAAASFAANEGHPPLSDPPSPDAALLATGEGHSSSSDLSDSDVGEVIPTLWNARAPFEDVDPQNESSLFKLPGELRDLIYDFALSPFEDQDQPYNPNNYRPGCTARRKTDFALLRTCKRVYSEAWRKPVSLATDFISWLCSDDRAPPGFTSTDGLADTVRLLYRHHGHVELAHVQFFAQMYALGMPELSSLLNMPIFHPMVITITIRHTDWWFWESDEGLRYDAEVPNRNVFPACTRKLILELETLERKTDQLDSIVLQMKRQWTVRRADGVVLSARNTELQTWRWQGSSILDSHRWVRDEVEPGLLDYCVAVIAFVDEHDPTIEASEWVPDLYPELEPERLSGSELDQDEVLSDTDTEDSSSVIDVDEAS